MSKSILDDNARRRPVAHVATVAAKKSTAKAFKKLLIVTLPAFFAQRDIKNQVKGTPSVRVMEQIKEKFDTVLVFISAKDLESHRDYFAGVDTCVIDATAVTESLERLTRKLMDDYGVEAAFPKNNRTVSWLNIGKYIYDKRVTVVGQNDHAVIGIDPDKEFSFQEMRRQRRRDGW